MIPESIRWLMAQKKTHEAGIMIQKAAQINGKRLSDEMIRAFELKPSSNGDISAMKKDLSRNELDEDSTQTWQTLKQFMSSRRIVFRFLILFFIWYGGLLYF